jgi:small conductance mechanosensitive channel
MWPLLVSLTPGAIADWFWIHGARIAVVVALVLIANICVRRIIPPAVRAAVLRDATSRNEIDLRKRADTLASVMVHTVQIGAIVLGAFLVLGELGFNMAPLLAGLGIGGLALGLGAQSLVRDTLNGIFILLEDQYDHGDLVSIAGVQGWVEEVNLRRTVLRDVDGTLFSIPNGEVKVAGNLTRGYSGINLLVPLTAASDVDRAMALIDEAGQELAADPDLGRLVVEAPKAVRVEALTDKGLTVRVLGKAMPGAQFEVAGALRRRIKRSFDAAEIRFGEPVPAPPAPAVAGAPR